MPEDQQFELILFDLEGTLVDFQWQLNNAIKEILPVLTKACIDLFQYGASPGYADLYNTTRDITKDWNPEKTVDLFDHLALIYDKYDQDALTRWTPYPDTRFLLETLKAGDYRMGIVSNIGSRAVKAVLDKFNILEYFEILVSRDDTSYLKPSSESLKLALSRLGIQADKALFVGDSINDILAANKISMPSCFLWGGESRVTGEKGHIATFQISCLSELVGILVH
jgi:phosphoglycolate phosphatase